MKRIAVVATLALGVLPGTAHALSSAAEIREALVGNTFQGDMGGGGYASYFAEDGTYDDASGGGVYEITDQGVCYPGTEWGCYGAQIDGMQLEWFKDGESAGTGMIEPGNTLD